MSPHSLGWFHQLWLHHDLWASVREADSQVWSQRDIYHRLPHHHALHCLLLLRTVIRSPVLHPWLSNRSRFQFRFHPRLALWKGTDKKLMINLYSVDDIGQPQTEVTT